MIKRMTRRIRRKRERRVRRCTKNRFVSLDYFVRGETRWRAAVRYLSARSV
jgi:hypothetical protein